MNDTDQMIEIELTDEALPEGWTWGKLGDIAGKVGSGITPKGGSKVYLQQGVPLVRSQNVLNGYLDLTDVAFISEEQHQKMKFTWLKPLDVLLNITGASIGRSCVVPPDFKEGNVNQHVCIIRTVREKINPYYLNYFLQSEQGQNQIDSFQAGGNRQGLNYEQVRSFVIPLPQIEEQQKIAAILRKWDEGIEKLQKLIAYKTELKRGLMDHLLTQKKRFKEFAGMAWDRVKLGKVCKKILNGGTPSTAIPEYWQGDIPWITGADFSGQEIKVVRRYISKEAVRNSSTNVVAKGDLLVVTRTGVGKLAIAPFDIAISQDITGLTVDSEKITTSYLFYILDHQAENFIKQNQGTSIAGITREVLVETEIFVPPLPEQQRIVAVLSASDLELKGLREELALLRQQKIGLLHRLLTRGTGREE